MSELSKKARNRTRVQMVLTMLVIVSIIRQFFLGNYQNVSWHSNIDFVYGATVYRQETWSDNSGWFGNGYSDLYLFGRDTWRNQCILCKDSGMGYHFAYNEWILDGGNRVCAD